MARKGQVPSLDNSAYVRMPKIGGTSLGFEPERYIPLRNCIDVDDAVKCTSWVADMNRHVRTPTATTRGASVAEPQPKITPNHAFGGWCNGTAHNGHPNRLIELDPTKKDTAYIPVGVRIKPTRDEQDVLAQIDSIFTSFPLAKSGTDEIVVPSDITMRSIPDHWWIERLNDKRRRDEDEELEDRQYND
ncbi:hypothetical protein PTMSG1_05025 [Pyrenophora teres f. maculata]|nr:hypothetical protein PTMSG1_05025 [Pyrenophora teres f. maculata]